MKEKERTRQRRGGRRRIVERIDRQRRSEALPGNGKRTSFLQITSPCYLYLTLYLQQRENQRRIMRVIMPPDGLPSLVYVF